MILGVEMALALASVTALLEELAPLEHAESWDNVGLLLEPERDRKDPALPPSVRRAMLFIDLTQPVLDEALRRDIDLLVAYHPPVFEPLKRLRASAPNERLVAAATRAGLAVYSPHTALDAAPGGVNDWLAEAVGPGTRRPLATARRAEPNAAYKLVVFVPATHVDALRRALSEAGAGVIGNYTECSYELAGSGTFLGGSEANPVVGTRGNFERAPETRLEMVCSEAALPRAAEALRRVHPYEEPAWDVYALAPKPLPSAGVGRSVTLDDPVPLATVVERVKAHLGRSALRVATAEGHRAGSPIRSVAVCAGSGGSVLARAPGHDLWVTGELRHHDVLAALARGTSVILAEHSSSERGYLPAFAERLRTIAGGALDIVISDADVEPLELA
jgi:dinuclear metal center YbgI/SA1388 family protein